MAGRRGILARLTGRGRESSPGEEADEREPGDEESPAGNLAPLTDPHGEPAEAGSHETPRPRFKTGDWANPEDDFIDLEPPPSPVPEEALAARAGVPDAEFTPKGDHVAEASPSDDAEVDDAPETAPSPDEDPSLEARLQEAEERAARLEEERDEVEGRAREAATNWLRSQVAVLKEEARRRIQEEVEGVRAETEARVRAELGAADEQPRSDADSHSVHEPPLEATGEADAEGELEAEERIARAEADAEERLRSEVAVARRAAEEHFATTLAAREEDLERERGERVKLAEESDQRLSRIEEQAAEADERVAVAERQLADEASRLRAAAQAELDSERERLAQQAAEAASARVAERERELEEARASAEQAQREADERVEEAGRRERAGTEAARAEAEERVAAAQDARATEMEAAAARAEAAEERARSAEAEAQATAHEARTEAASWLEGQSAALRREGEGSSGKGEVEAAERLAAAQRAWEEDRAELAAELAAATAEPRPVEGAPPKDPEPIDARDDDDEDEDWLPRPPVAAEPSLPAADASPAQHVEEPPSADDIPGDDEGSEGGSVPENEGGSAEEAEPAPVSLTSAEFDQLRGIGLSVTQAGRVLRYRDQRGLKDVAGLADVPGFPRAFLNELEGRLVD